MSNGELMPGINWRLRVAEHLETFSKVIKPDSGTVTQVNKPNIFTAVPSTSSLGTETILYQGLNPVCCLLGGDNCTCIAALF